MKMSVVERTHWINGFIEGLGESFKVWLPETWSSVSDAQRKVIRSRLTLMYDESVLEAVMTSLYGDPTNTFIPPYALVYIAKARLNGDELEPLLRYARQNECSGPIKR